MPCSQCAGIEQVFNDAEAKRQLRRLNRRGPVRTTRLLIDAIGRALEATGVRDATLLDIGAGIGAIHHELLDGPVARATHVDGSSAHISVARAEVQRRGHSDRVEFKQGDFVEMATDVPATDVVTLDRVICCYPDMELLVSRSAQKAGRLYGAVYPRQVAWMRVGIWAINLIQRVKGSAFRVFLHAPARIDAVLRTAGLERVMRRQTLGWEVAVYSRRLAFISHPAGDRQA